MVSPSDLTWPEKGYAGWQGWLWSGTCPWELPGSLATLKDDEKLAAVVMTTESPKRCLDAAQSYDSLGLTVGALQWGEIGAWSVTKLLGACKATDPKLLAPLRAAMDAAGVELLEQIPGKWRFKSRTLGWVDTPQKQSQMLRGKASGRAGSWTSESKALNALWVAGCASVFQQTEAQQIQLAWTFARIRMFVLPEAKAILWGPGTPLNDQGIYGALRAAFISYAANRQDVARGALLRAVRTSKEKPWSSGWVADVLEELVFGSDYEIYADRYTKIVGPIQEAYQVVLPPIEDTDGLLRTVLSMQKALMALGYDLGPAGADGVEGVKTRKALSSFQQAYGLKVDGKYGPQTRQGLLAEVVRSGVKL